MGKSELLGVISSAILLLLLAVSSGLEYTSAFSSSELFLDELLATFLRESFLYCYNSLYLWGKRKERKERTKKRSY